MIQQGLGDAGKLGPKYIYLDHNASCREILFN